MSREGRCNFLFTHVGRARDVSDAIIRRRLASLYDLCPFSVRTECLQSDPRVQLYLVEAPIALLDEAATEKDLAPFTAVPFLIDRQEIERLSSHCIWAYSQIATYISVETKAQIRIGRPLVIAAEVGSGQCRLTRFSRDDWRVYRFSTPQDRERSFATFEFGQNWISNICDHNCWGVHHEPGCVVSLGVGCAVGT